MRRLTPEREKEIRDYYQTGKSVHITELFVEIDALREERTNRFLSFGGKGIGQVLGLSNCSDCKNLSNDYYIIGESRLCLECYAAFPKSLNELGSLRDRVAKLRDFLHKITGPNYRDGREGIRLSALAILHRDAAGV